MDISSLTESQQQQLQQLHQQFQQHQLQQQQEEQQLQQQQQEQQQFASQVYDPNQAQAYDQSTQAYYAYHQYQHPQQQYPYYDYSNAYQNPQPDSTPIQPPGISAPPPESSQPYLAHEHQQNVYYPQPPEQQQQPNPSYPVPSGLNPAAAAAVAALSQLTQFAGTMDAAERAMAGLHDRQWHAKGGGYGPGGPMQMPPHIHPHGVYHHQPFPPHAAGRTPYRGGGRRGGGHFRGGGRGNSGHRPPRTDGSAPQFRGKGRGRGGGRRSTQRASSHSQSTPTAEVVPTVEAGDVHTFAADGEASVSATVPPSAVASVQPLVTTPVSGKAPSARRQSQIAWCELCRVDCTSLDILEQHKNGKKHKKNLQKFEQSQNARNLFPMPIAMPMITSTPTPTPASASYPATAPTLMPAPDVPTEALTSAPVSEAQNESESLPESKAEVSVKPENVVGAVTSENLPTETTTGGNKTETEQQNELVSRPEVVEAQPNEAPARKWRSDRFDARNRGNKRKMVRGGRGGKRMRPTFERPVKPAEPPKVVVPMICELCNVKCDTQAVFDCHLAGKKHIARVKRFQGHQAMFGSLGLQALYPPNQNAQPVFIPTPLHQQSMYPPQGAFSQSAVYMPPPFFHQAAAEFHSQKNSINQDVPVTSVGNQKGRVQQAAAVEPEGQLVIGTKSGNGVILSAEKVLDIPSVLPPSQNDTVGSSYVVPASVDATASADYGIITTENVTLAGLDIKMGEAATSNTGESA